MKKIVMIGVFLSSLLLAQNSGLGNYDKSIFEKYKIPETEYYFLKIDGTYHLSTFSNSTNIAKSAYNSYTLDLKPEFTYLIEDDASRLKVFSNLSANRRVSERESDYQNSNENNINNYNFNLRFINSVSYKSYQQNFHFSIVGNANFELDEYEYENYSLKPQYNLLDGNFENNKNQFYNVKLGIGIGRIRDVTSIVKALRFQERAKKINVIDSDIPMGKIIKIAEQFSRTNYYFDYYDRPDKYLWSEIENVLENNHINFNELNIHSSSYLFETLKELHFRRNIGWELSLSSRLDYFNAYSTNRNNSSGGNGYIVEFTNKRSEDITFGIIELQFSYSYPINLDSQFSLDLLINTGKNISNNQWLQSKSDILLYLGYDYEISDRLAINLSNTFVHRYKNDEVDLTSNVVRLNTFYFIEDQITFNNQISWTYSFNEFLAPNGYDTNAYSRGLYISGGFTYFFDSSIFTK